MNDRREEENRYSLHFPRVVNANKKKRKGKLKRERARKCERELEREKERGIERWWKDRWRTTEWVNVCVRESVGARKEGTKPRSTSFLVFPLPPTCRVSLLFRRARRGTICVTVRCANRHSLSMVAKSLSSSGEVDSKRVKNNFPNGKFNRQPTSSRRTDRGENEAKIAAYGLLL